MRASTTIGQGQREKKETGEPDDAKVSRPVRGGAGSKGRNDLARSLPYCQWGTRYGSLVAYLSQLRAAGTQEESHGAGVGEHRFAAHAEPRRGGLEPGARWGSGDG